MTQSTDATLNNPLLLIVDDERVVCDAIARHLKDQGYDVLVAYSGASAIEMIQKHDIDIALLDIRMPKINGFGVLDVLKKKTPNAKAIMMTSYADITSAVDAISKGAIDILSKPVDIDEIIMTVRRCLES